MSSLAHDIRRSRLGPPRRPDAQVRCRALTHGMDPLCCSVPGWRGLAGRVAGSFGGCCDVAEHPAEYDAVERRYGSPVCVSGESAWLEDGPLAVGGHAVMVSAGRHFEPGQAG